MSTNTSLCVPYLPVCVCVLAPHIEDLVLLPSPVLRLLNLIDDSHLHNDEEYEGEATSFSFFLNFDRLGVNQLISFSFECVDICHYLIWVSLLKPLMIRIRIISDDLFLV